LKIIYNRTSAKIYFTIILCVLLGYRAIAQKANANYRYHIKRATSDITIDGIMSEPAWQQADSAANFHMVLPMDTSLAKVHTVVRMTYDDKNLYILVICYNLIPGPYMVESMKRDFSFVKNDNFIFFIDPFDARTDGFTFGANAAGGQWDGSMYAGGSVDLNWDNKWASAVKNYPDKWVFEAAIPFKSIRYKKGIKEWGINFSRNDLKTTEKYRGSSLRHRSRIPVHWFGMKTRRRLPVMYPLFLMPLPELPRITRQELRLPLKMRLVAMLKCP